MPSEANRHAGDTGGWPESPAALVEVQRELAALRPPRWHFDPADWATLRIAACYVCFGRGGGGAGAPGDLGWAGAALFEGDACVKSCSVTGRAQAGYEAGLLALREGPLLEAAVRALGATFDLLLVDATGRDHPHGAGLAVHLGARLGLPTVGVTNRLLVASECAHEGVGVGVGVGVGEGVGAMRPFRLAGATAGVWVRTRVGVRPVAAHAAWRTDPETAAAVVLATAGRARTPEPLRVARRVARTARHRAMDSQGPARVVFGSMNDPSLQERYAPHNACFGCGPSNARGLRMRSFYGDGVYTATWQAAVEHEAFPGVVSGGILGTLLDCHMNWSAAHHLMQTSSSDSPPCTVTAEYAVELRRPTPSGVPLTIEARIVESSADRARVESTLTADGKVCARGSGTFVAVRPGHPAYHRW